MFPRLLVELDAEPVTCKQTRSHLRELNVDLLQMNRDLLSTEEQDRNDPRDQVRLTQLEVREDLKHAA